MILPAAKVVSHDGKQAGRPDHYMCGDNHWKPECFKRAETPLDFASDETSQIWSRTYHPRHEKPVIGTIMPVSKNLDTREAYLSGCQVE